MRSSRFTFSASAARAARDDVDGDDEEEEPGEVIESAPPLKVGEERTIHGSSGITKKLLRSGSGWETPNFGDEVTVHYVGTVVGGPKVDSSSDNGGPVIIKLGEGQVVSGLDEGIITMKKGECALFTLSADACADLDKKEGIPLGSTLHYDVELISWISVVDVYRDGGMVKRILSRGDGGKPGDLDEVTVRYQVKLHDGLMVAQSSEGGDEFYVNDGLFCPALSKLIKTMERGEKASVCVQPKYAFAELGKNLENGSSIPPHSALTIDLELLSYKSVIDISGDLKVLKKILRSGDGIQVPKEGELVRSECIQHEFGKRYLLARVKCKGMLEEDGTVFEKFGFDGGDVCEFVIDEEQVIPGLEQAAATMAKGEISLLTVKPEYGFGDVEVKRDLATIPACSTLSYEIEMLDFTQEKGIWEMNAGEKLEAASKLKECGNGLFKSGKHQRAAKKFNKAVEYVIDDEAFHDEERKLAKSLRVSCWLNGAACSLKLDDFRDAARLCSKVLDAEFHNVKALYRRAQAYIGTSDFELADLDVKTALGIDPENREMKSIQKTLKRLRVENDKRDAKLYSNMFAQLAKEADIARKKQKLENITDVEKQQSEVEEVEMDDVTASTDSSVDAMVLDLSGNFSKHHLEHPSASCETENIENQA